MPRDLPQGLVKSPLRIRIISPLYDMSAAMLEGNRLELAPLRALGIECDNVTIGGGPRSIEGPVDEAFAAPFVVIEAIRAEAEGVDAIVIDCMGDPGLMAAREAVSIPVIGPGQASMHVASICGERFSCVSILDSVRPVFFAHARAYGVLDKLASVRVIGLPVLDIDDWLRDGRLLAALYDQSVACIEKDQADTIVLGCTGFLGVARALATALRCGLAAGLGDSDSLHDSVRRQLDRPARVHPVRVVNPLPVAVLLAATMVWGGLGASHGLPERKPVGRMHGYPALDWATRPAGTGVSQE